MTLVIDLLRMLAAILLVVVIIIDGPFWLGMTLFAIVLAGLVWSLFFRETEKVW